MDPLTWRWVLVLSVLVVGQTAATSIDQPSKHLYYLSAKQFGERMALVTGRLSATDAIGLTDAHEAMVFLEAVADMIQDDSACPTPTERMSQIFQVTDDYLQAHPELSDQPAVKVISMALAANYPCKSRHHQAINLR